MRAVVESNKDDNDVFDPIRCLICKGREDVIIRISDKGGGIARSQTDMLFNYLYSTAPRPGMQSGSVSAPLVSVLVYIRSTGFCYVYVLCNRQSLSLLNIFYRSYSCYVKMQENIITNFVNYREVIASYDCNE